MVRPPWHPPQPPKLRRWPGALLGHLLCFISGATTNRMLSSRCCVCVVTRETARVVGTVLPSAFTIRPRGGWLVSGHRSPVEAGQPLNELSPTHHTAGPFYAGGQVPRSIRSDPKGRLRTVMDLPKMNRIYQDHPVGVSWLDYPTLPIGFHWAPLGWSRYSLRDMVFGALGFDSQPSFTRKPDASGRPVTSID